LRKRDERSIAVCTIASATLSLRIKWKSYEYSDDLIPLPPKSGASASFCHPPPHMDGLLLRQGG
jgi:hypothetical protein